MRRSATSGISGLRAFSREPQLHSQPIPLEAPHFKQILMHFSLPFPFFGLFVFSPAYLTQAGPAAPQPAAARSQRSAASGP
jgi:hypothetical protein